MYFNATGLWATEKHDDFAKTMLFLWRNRNKNINNVGAGVGMAVGP